LSYLDENAVVRALELNFILRGVHIIGYATGKASIGAFILRLIGPQSMWQKWAVWVLIIFTTLVNVLNCIFIFVQCSPVQGNWIKDFSRLLEKGDTAQVCLFHVQYGHE
jgi:hypothetical protein